MYMYGDTRSLAWLLLVEVDLLHSSTFSLFTYCHYLLQSLQPTMPSFVSKALMFGALAASCLAVPRRAFSMPDMSGFANGEFPSAAMLSEASAGRPAASQASTAQAQVPKETSIQAATGQDATGQGAANSASAESSTTASSSNLCGDTSNQVLSGTPWIVYNMFYNSAQAQGTQCTKYDSQTTSNDGAKQVVWTSETKIEYVESTYVPTLIRAIPHLFRALTLYPPAQTFPKATPSSA